MNKVISELVNQSAVVVELVDTLVQQKSGQGWTEIYAHKFASKNILLEKIDLLSNKNINLLYYDETNDYISSVVVPPDFMFKMPDNDKVQEIVRKYKAYLLSHLDTSCSFVGMVGSDPEIFVEDAKGKIIPAFKFLGSKAKPNRVLGYVESHGVQRPSSINRGNDLYWDGFQAEFTTHATACMGWHGDSLQAGLKGLYEALLKYDKNAKLSIKTVFDIPDKMLKAAAPEHVAFGCNPSLNAYGMKGLEMPGTAIKYRSAGGHVHLGFTNPRTKDEYINMVKALDAIVGVAGVSMCAKYDDPRRRIMYGLAGEYRLPPHGLEYRVLSNAWLFHPVLANIVFDLSRTAAMFGQNKMLPHWDATEAETIEVINTCNVDGARKILARNKDLLLKLLGVKLGDEIYSNYAYKAITEGLESIIKDPSDIVKNWDLDKPSWKGHGDGKNKNVHFTISNGGSGGKEKI